MNRDLRLLALLSAPSLNREAIEELISDPVEWSELLKTARLHKIHPLVFSNLLEHFRDRLPPEVRNGLEARRRTISLRSLGMLRELIAVKDLLGREAIEPVSFKGPLMAMTLYGDLSLRECRDLDILVPDKDFLRASAILFENGYTNDDGITQKHLEISSRSPCHHHTGFVSPGGGYLIELHNSLIVLNLLPFYNERFFLENLTWSESARTKMRILSVEAQLVYLCLHGLGHLWLRLCYACDLAHHIARYKDLDYEKVLSYEKGRGGGRMVLLGLATARELYGAPLPPKVEEAIAEDPEVSRLLKKTTANLPGRMPVGQTLYISWFLWKLRIERGAWRKTQTILAYPFHRLLPITYNDVKFIALPRRLHALYPLVKIFRNIHSLFRRAPGGKTERG